MALAGKMKYEEEGKVHYTNGTGDTLPVRSIVVSGDKVAVLANELADGETGIAYTTGTWPMPVLSTLTPAEGDILGWDAADGEWNDDLVNNTIHAVVAADADGNLCAETDTQWLRLG